MEERRSSAENRSESGGVRITEPKRHRGRRVQVQRRIERVTKARLEFEN